MRVIRAKNSKANDDCEFLIIEELKTVNFCDTYSQDGYGEDGDKLDCINSGCYSLNNTLCSEIRDDLKKALEKEFELKLADFDGYYHNVIGLMAGIEEFYEEKKKENFFFKNFYQENKVHLQYVIKKFNENKDKIQNFIEKWLKKNEKHTACTAYTYSDGVHFHSLIVSLYLYCDNYSYNYEEIDEELEEEILKAYEQADLYVQSGADTSDVVGRFKFYKKLQVTVPAIAYVQIIKKKG